VQSWSRTLALLHAKENIRLFKDLLLEILEQWLRHGISERKAHNRQINTMQQAIIMYECKNRKTDEFWEFARVYQRTRIASKGRTGWSSMLLDIFDRVILLWVYKMVDVKYSRWGGTKVWVQLKWSLVETGAVSQPPITTVTLSSNGLGKIISSSCYCDLARLAATERSNRRGDGINQLLLWPSSTSHRKIYDINKQSELNITQNRVALY
jgi:hypothetical protein